MKDKDYELIEGCQCGCHALQLRIFFDETEYECYFDFLAAIYSEGWNWKERIGAIWRILWGRDVYLWEIGLVGEQARRIAEFILERVVSHRGAVYCPEIGKEE